MPKDMQDLANQFVLNEISLEKFLKEHEKVKEEKLKRYNKTLDQYLMEKQHELSMNSLVDEYDRE